MNAANVDLARLRAALEAGELMGPVRAADRPVPRYPVAPRRAPDAIKALHILPSPTTAGAARGALSVFRGLRDLGVDARLLGNFEASPPADLQAASFSRTDALVSRIAHRLRREQLRARFGMTSPLFHPITLGAAPHRHTLFGWADLVHIQWAHASGLGRRFWAQLGQVTMPMLFTLRDQWLFTGGCHFAEQCRAYETGCHRCHMLGDAPQTLTAQELARKADAYAGGPTFVAISQRIAREARRSLALRNADIRLIPNAIDVNSFHPVDKGVARRALGLSPDAFIAATGACWLSDPRKGAAQLQQALAILGDRPDLHWAAFGGAPFPLPAGATYFGTVEDRERLNLIYAAADVFVMPSLQESFGKTTAEALAAGTPVIAFDNTPAEEIIADGETGWLVTHGDAGKLAAMIAAAAATPRDRLAAMGLAGRDKVLRAYAPATVARAHLNLYEELLERHASRNPA